MKKKMRNFFVGALLIGFVGSSASAATVPYKAPRHVFSMGDLLGTFTGTMYAQDPSLVCLEAPCPGNNPKIDENTGAVTYPIDSEFAFTVTDFVGAERKTLDGVYEEGWIGNLFNENGMASGVVISSPETPYFKTGGLKGSWCAGLGGNSVKCSAEIYTVMEHVLTCTEKVPYFYTEPGFEEICKPLSDELYFPDDPDNPADPFTLVPNESDLVNIVSGRDYSMTMKDDGKFLYRWGSMHKRPTDVRLYAKIQLPEAWKEDGADFTVTRAELVINHKITNNPNDQIRPEDFENEGAKGRIPGFINTNGVWTSDRDCFEGDGHYIPAGTLFKDPAYGDANGWSSDLREGFTNAWYTTMDRNPFEADEFERWGPRYRLKAPKFGQNLPALEIPIVDCTPPPLRKGDIRYVVGSDTSTVINLLDWADGPSPLSTSSGWKDYLDSPDQNGNKDGLSDVEGLPLTDDFDLAVYIKGDYKSTVVYSAILLLEYEDSQVMDQAELCSDGVDNDGDGYADCDDSDCGGAWCPETLCFDGLDNDEDSFVDCGDPDCLGVGDCQIDGKGEKEQEICNDGIDNNGNGLIDCADPDCARATRCGDESSSSTCSDAFDNDGDGLIDCLDSDCAGLRVCR